MEARERKIKDWFTKIRTRQVVLPRFQRHEAWSPNKIAEMLTSVINDLPVGSALTLDVGNKVPFENRPIKGAPERGDRINELLLDGQQRLTALWRSLKDDYSRRTYLVDLVGDEDNPGPLVVHYSTNLDDEGKRYPLWIDNAVDCWKNKLIPVRLLDPDDENAYKSWADIASIGDLQIARQIDQDISMMRAKVSNFNLPFLSLPSTTSPHVAIDVFLKLNTNVAPLKAYDIIVAQLEAATGSSLHNWVDKLNSQVPELQLYVPRVENHFLQTAALMQNKAPNERGYFQLDLNKLSGSWENVIEGSKRLVEFLTEQRVLDGTRLPTQPILAPIAAILADAPLLSDAGGNTRVLLTSYMWSAFFSGRYDLAAASVALSDYKAISDVIHKGAPQSKIKALNRKDFPLPNRQALIDAGWPAQRRRLARAILLITQRGRSEDISDGSHLTRENISSREYHHLYPRAWVKSKGYSEDIANRALNCILITWKTNRDISAKEPTKYLKERAKYSELGDAEIRRRLATHAVDFDLLNAGDYDAYLQSRAKSVEKAMKDLCNGVPWQP